MWHHGKNDQYSVKSGYHIEMESRQNEASSEGDGASGWWKKLWSCKVPNKVKIHLWHACYNAIPARSHLQRRGVLIDHSCPRCGDEVEALLQNVEALLKNGCGKYGKNTA